MNDTPLEAIQPLLKKQRDAFHAEGFPSVESRKDRLVRMARMLKKYDSAFCEALNEDFGCRSTAWSRFADIAAVVGNVLQCIEHVESWMQDGEFSPMEPFASGGAKGLSVYQPKGVVGVIGPWNFPIHLVLVPAINALAAGNRVMMKPSEITPRSSAVLKQAVEEFFDEAEVAVVNGDVSLSSAFSSLPFDHLVFTGSTAVGKIVMRAAAENLVPVTLELGGKSPVIVRPDADLPRTCRRLMAAKSGNSGQWCVSPDYVYVPTELMDDFIEGCRQAFAELYPEVENNAEYTSIVNDNHYQRLSRMVDDANQRGYKVVEFNPANESYDQAANRKMLMKCIVDPAWDSAVMGEEIFGPIMALLPYDDYDKVISTIMDGPRALALYYFGEDEAEQQQFIRDTISGGAAINDSCWHVASDQMPLGGVGDSGMGRYHGIYGFREFSNLRGIMVQTPVEEVTSFYYPPYGDELLGTLESIMGGVE